MAIQMKRGKWLRLTVLLLCLIVLSTMIDMLFIGYRRELNARFLELEKEMLTSNVASAGAEAAARITDLENSLVAVAALVEQTALDPSAKAFEEYLDKMAGSGQGYRVDYVTMESLREGLGDPTVQQADYEIYRQLERGEKVVSSLRYSNRRSGYFFSVAVPVRQQGETIGVLRCLFPADVLLPAEPLTALHTTAAQFIVSDSGAILYAPDKKTFARDAVLQNEMTASGMEEQITEQVRRSLIDAQAETIPIVTEDEQIFFLSETSLGYNGWHLVCVSRSTLLADMSKSLMQRMIVISLLLMLTVAVAAIILAVSMRRMKREQRIERERYGALANFTDTVLFEYNYKTDALDLTGNAMGMLPLADCHVEGVHQAAFADMEQSSRQAFIEMLDRAAETDQTQTVELCMHHEGKDDIWCECSAQALGGAKGNADILVGKITDITARKAREMRLLDRSRRDALTALLNRASIEQAVNDRLREDGKGLLLMFDIDRFKEINDSEGHAAGDRALIILVESLRAAFRKNDLIGRIGGDEFAVLLSGTDDAALGGQKAELVRGMLAERSEEQRYTLTVSIGIAVCPRDGGDFAALFRAADAAMYLAKKRGRNRHQFYDPQDGGK